MKVFSSILSAVARWKYLHAFARWSLFPVRYARDKGSVWLWDISSSYRFTTLASDHLFCIPTNPFPQNQHMWGFSFLELIRPPFVSGVTRNSGAPGQNIKVGPLPWVPSTVTCMEVRGVVLSTAASGKVLKIDSYFCRRWFFAQFGVWTHNLCAFMQRMLGITFAHRVPMGEMNMNGIQKLQMLLMP